MGLLAVTARTRAAGPRGAAARIGLLWALGWAWGLALGMLPAEGGDRSPVLGAGSSTSSPVPPPPRPAMLRAKPGRTGALPPPPSAEMPPPPPAPAVSAEARRIRVRTESGATAIARVHGVDGERVSVLLPDGQIRFARGLAYTDEPFRPAAAAEVRRELHDGPFADFRVYQTPHYLLFFQSSEEFAKASGHLLEKLYKGVGDAFRKRNVPIHDAEFPLVAVIFRTEKDFREYKPVAPDVQAYYEILTNRIYLYEHSRRDEAAPEVAALRRPQTVAHEGTHQVLANIGIQPRLSSWPMWLVEGLAEYCSPPVQTKRGDVAWKGLGAVNPLHMATIHDLDDQMNLNIGGAGGPLIGRDPRQPLLEYVVTRTELTPTDYALSWAVTHYLALERADDFVAYLARMSRMPPLEPRSPEQHLAEFRAAFGGNLAKLDKSIGAYLGKLKYKELPYYAVVFEQPLGPRLKRAAMVSQSPLIIRQWIDTMSHPRGGIPNWEAKPLPTRTQAILFAEHWLRSR